ncbi:MAG: glycoside hydrolase family 10 protein [Huintestinicola sp.]
MKQFFLRKYRVTAVLAAAAVILSFSSCARLEEGLPDTDIMTDSDTVTLVSDADITDTSTASQTITLPSSDITSETTLQEIFLSDSAEEETSSLTEAPSQTVTETPETDIVTETVTETTAVTEETTAASSAESTMPQITIVTLPKKTESAESESAVTEASAEPTVDASGLIRRNYSALNFSRQKAVWISYLEYERIMKNKSRDEFTDSLAICFDNISKLGCNTVYFQVRAYGDAYYSSSVFPSGDRLTGDYDPLEIAVRLAHDRGLSIHAWINPMRLMTDTQMRSLPDSYQIKKWYNDPAVNGKYMVNTSGRWYLNPAYGETVSLICKGISEIVSGYDVDGIQIDDYFYPTTDASFDSFAYSASGTSLSLGDWRRENTSGMVRKIYATVHEANPTAVFGISPQGNINSDINELYADVRLWAGERGYCDYICPQIYYGFDNGSLPYTETVDAWSKLLKRNDISLVIGLAAYKSGLEDKYAGDGKYEWQENTDILARQVSVTDIYGAGYAFFRYDSLFMPDPSAAVYASAELDNLKKQQ